MAHRRARLSGGDSRAIRNFLFYLHMAAAAGALTLPALPASAATASQADTYALAAGDRILVTVAGQPDLSGEVVVDGAGKVVLPFIGPVQVGDLTVNQCQQLVSSRLAAGYLMHPEVSVRITEPRPFYILGDVKTPGSYPFRYGITVKSAVATAGGFALAETPIQSLVVSEYLQAEERLRQLLFERASLLVRQGRLEAQIAGRDSFAVSTLPELPPGADISRIVAAEKATMDAQSALVKSQISLLLSQKPQVQGEIDAINGEITNEKGRLEFVRAEIDRSGQLLKQGIGTRSPEVQLKLDEATEESNIWRLTADVSRLQRELGDLALKIQEAEISVRKDGIAELRTVRGRLAELDVALPSVRAQRDWKLQQAGGPVDQEVSRTITITRTRRAEATVISADATALLEPGDVIEIKRVPPSAVLPQLSAAM